jgi:microcystin-dependent protein
MSVQDFEATLAEGGYGGLRRLSPAAELLLASVNIYDYFVWSNNNGQPLTEEQRETIDLRNAEAQYELITEETDMPIGSVIPIAVTTVPSYALVCDGTVYQRVDYPDLYAILSPLFIIDADSFRVPDLFDRFIRGNASVDATIGTPGGTNQVTIAEFNLPAHTHFYSQASGVPITTTPGPVPAQSFGSLIQSTGSTGGGAPLITRPRNMLLRYIIIAR